MEIKFLNVDLVIYSTECLQYLADELVKDVFVHFNGEWENGMNCFSLSVKYSFGKTADEIISELCFLIENLSSESRLIWENSHSKKFDIGFESGNVERLETEIKSENIERIAKLGASILITIYTITD